MRTEAEGVVDRSPAASEPHVHLTCECRGDRALCGKDMRASRPVAGVPTDCVECCVLAARGGRCPWCGKPWEYPG